MSLRTLLLTPLVLLLLAACDEDSGDSGGTDVGSIDNCSLLTDAEAEAIAGEPVGEPTDSLLGCGWPLEGESIAQFSLDARTADSSPRELLETEFSGGKVFDLPGLGDAAAYRVREESVGNLAVQQGNVMLLFVTTFIDMPEGSAEFEALQDGAEAALGRL